MVFHAYKNCIKTNPMIWSSILNDTIVTTRSSYGWLFLIHKQILPFGWNVLSFQGWGRKKHSTFLYWKLWLKEAKQAIYNFLPFLMDCYLQLCNIHTLHFHIFFPALLKNQPWIYNKKVPFWPIEDFDLGMNCIQYIM